MDANVLPPILLALAVLVIAFFYASIGFGGASGYLAAMSLFAIPTMVMSSTALTLNVLVSALSFTAFYRSGHLNWRLLWPFLITSIPAAFLGGYLKVDTQVYLILLNLALTYVAVRLLLFEFFSRKRETVRNEFPLSAGISSGVGDWTAVRDHRLGRGHFPGPADRAHRLGQSQAGGSSGGGIHLPQFHQRHHGAHCR